MRNGERFLQKTLNSLLNSDFDDFELIISDNASDDATPDISRTYARRDPRIRYSRLATNYGAAYNYNRTFALARGRFFKWAAHDDECYPGFFTRCLEVFESQGDSVVLVYPRVEMIDADGESLGVAQSVFERRDRRPHRRLSWLLRQIQWASPVFGVMRSDAMRKTRLIRAFIGSDVVFLAEMSLLGEIREVPEVLFRQRLHDGMSTKANRGRALRAWYAPAHATSWSVLPWQAELGFRYWGAIWRMPLEAGEKLLCTWVVISSFFVPYLHNVGGKYKRIVISWIKAQVARQLGWWGQKRRGPSPAEPAGRAAGGRSDHPGQSGGGEGRGPGSPVMP